MGVVPGRGALVSRVVSAVGALAACVCGDPSGCSRPPVCRMTTPQFDRHALRAALLERLPEFVRAYAPADTVVREHGHEIRIGRKGSIAIARDQGLYFDFEHGRGGDVLALAAELTGARDFPSTLRAVAAFVGGVPMPASRDRTRRSRPKTSSTNTRAAARKIWKATRPIGATLAAAYLDARGVEHVASAAALRFHASLSHPNGPGGFPALVAGVQDVSGRFLGIQRTYLHGSHKAAVEPVRASLGSLAGGAVRLGEPVAGRLLIGEGIESTAAAMRVLDWQGGAWATLGTSGLRAVVLSAEIRDVVIVADRDANGAGQLAAAALAWRLEAEGRVVEIVIPTVIGHDFADELKASRDA